MDESHLSDDSPDATAYLSEAAGLISKKWHPVLVQVLLDSGPLGFSDLEDRLDGISAKVLTDALAELQENGLVERRVLSESPLRVEYALTPKGEDLQTTLSSLAAWGERHLAEEVGPPVVLVVDDNRRIAEMHAEWLDREYEVRTAYDGDDAVRALDDDTDLVVLDRRMPGRSGDELVDWIRNERFDCRILLLTSRDPGTDLLDLGFDEYLRKPTTKSELLDTVAAVLDRREYDGPVREYLALRSKQALLRAELAHEDREDNEAYGRLVSRIDELETEVDEVPEETVRSLVTEGPG
ncbi:MAG: winged helix-turn-helix transcriptional regulator [Salinirussus sp.]